MKILVTGDRLWSNEDAMRLTLEQYKNPHEAITLIEGEAPGADVMSAKVATEFGWTVVRVPANWDKYGRSAGPIRNREMLNMQPDLVLGFHTNIWNSKGTLDCMKEAGKRGIRVKLIQG